MAKQNKSKKTRKRTFNKKYLVVLISLIIAIFCGAGIDVAIRPTKDGDFVIETTFSMRLAEEQQPALVENSEGEEVEEENIVTVEEIEGNQLFECGEDEECGQGKYIYAPTGTFQEFKDYTLGKCFDVDGHYGSQCWDLASLFFMNYTKDGRVLSTCGTGSAKGAWNCKEQNAGSEFDLIYDKTHLVTGDIIITGAGQYGHVCQASGNYNNGYITCLGENQGGKACAGGGSATNIINLSLNSFVGAFRPKTYIKPKPEPKPEPIPVSGCVDWHVIKGDTMSKIMLECEGTVIYGDAMDSYAKTWYSLVYKPNQSVYDGWHSKSGVGLYAGDDIEHRIK